MYDISNAKRIVKTRVISKLVRTRKGSIYRERMKEGYEKKNRVLFTICSVRLFESSRASATSALVPRVHGTPAAQEGHGKDLSRGEIRKRQRDVPRSRALRRG